MDPQKTATLNNTICTEPVPPKDEVMHHHALSRAQFVLTLSHLRTRIITRSALYRAAPSAIYRAAPSAIYAAAGTGPVPSED